MRRHVQAALAIDQVGQQDLCFEVSTDKHGPGIFREDPLPHPDAGNSGAPLDHLEKCKISGFGLAVGMGLTLVACFVVSGLIMIQRWMIDVIDVPHFLMGPSSRFLQEALEKCSDSC